MDRQLGVVWVGDGLRVGWGILVRGGGGSWCGRENMWFLFEGLR